MGMDVIGVNPNSETGSHFRNNVWWWRPLWNYCTEVSEVARSVEDGQSNSGDGLDEDGARELGQILLAEIKAGRTAQYQENYYNELAKLDREPCSLCDKTGIRTDTVGVEHGMNTKALSIELAVVVGRTHGWCNGCDGMGDKPDFATNYGFAVENVQEFAEFLLECGGFEIC